MPKISITIPTHNRANLISRAIRSIKNQSFEDWELIIVDDGSTDNTEEVISPFLKDERIKYVNKINSGAAHSRNVGVQHSTGEFVTFLDSDDEADKDWLQEYIKVIDLNDASVVCCGLEILDESGKLVEIKLPGKLEDLFENHEGQFTNGGSYLLKKQIFTAIGGFDNELRSGQHTELSIRLIPYLDLNNIKIFNIKESHLKIHIHLGDRIRYNNKAKYLGCKRTLTKHYNFFKLRPTIKSNYEGIVAFNAYKIGLKKEANHYAWESLKSKPSLKKILRIFKYNLFKS
ncbi:Glycosyltransferase involved in cell wall bisynthesis [Gillisia sp. Hel1_33_143]|uniref:glycosyltransferase family 2 protein n=1 Tax=unclassified Gillisia TaxID=2615025 RepID=UPI000555A2AA|nr:MULTISPECIES: glycosyltransferase family A protein [unclassified Gillisia]SDS79789.1 Glycosyltransferase involved in cell wall bisynthesis [Gillisia sp. Hel1_33_143]